MKKTITYKSGKNKVRLDVTDDGLIFINGKILQQSELSKNKYKIVKYYDYTNKVSFPIYVHRAVCLAFCFLCHGIKKSKNRCFVDHIDNNPHNNNATNLRWVTRKENNSTTHKRYRNSVNGKSHSHRGLVIMAINRWTGDIMYYKNGRDAAKNINCSHVLVYNVINPDYPAYHAKGWSLKWVDECNIKN